MKKKKRKEKKKKRKRSRRRFTVAVRYGDGGVSNRDVRGVIRRQCTGRKA